MSSLLLLQPLLNREFCVFVEPLLAAHDFEDVVLPIIYIMEYTGVCGVNLVFYPSCNLLEGVRCQLDSLLHISVMMLATLAIVQIQCIAAVESVTCLIKYLFIPEEFRFVRARFVR